MKPSQLFPSFGCGISKGSPYKIIYSYSRIYDSKEFLVVLIHGFAIKFKHVLRFQRNTTGHRQTYLSADKGDGNKMLKCVLVFAMVSLNCYNYHLIMENKHALLL